MMSVIVEVGRYQEQHYNETVVLPPVRFIFILISFEHIAIGEDPLFKLTKPKTPKDKTKKQRNDK